MDRFRWLDEHVAAMAQLRPDDMRTLAEAGVTDVVNHRPDYEEPGQPRSPELAAHAAEAGLNYFHIPVTGLPGTEAIARTVAALEAAGPDARFAFFCRSGMRSAAAWAGARRLQGADADDLRARAVAAGYDLSRAPL